MPWEERGTLLVRKQRARFNVAMISDSFPFDAVIFDLDGTLVATESYWVPAARVGARRAFEELGLAREVPTRDEWMSLVGLPLTEGFDLLFADLEPSARVLVKQYCEEEEHFRLKAGDAALLPGVEEALAELRGRGVRLGIASNCTADYLESMLENLGLREYVEAARCLDSPNIHDKAGMVEDILWTLGTRSAVMVGDRAGDREAAHANGLPHVHVESGFAPLGEEVGAEASIADFGELLPRLEARQLWIAETLDALALPPAGRPRSLGITGKSGSGKTLFARDLARLVRGTGEAVAVVSLDDFERRDSPARTGRSEDLAPLEHLDRAFDVDTLRERVLEPHARGEEVIYDRPHPTRPGERLVTRVPARALLVLEGLFLAHPRLRACLDRLLHLEVPEELCLTRVAGRDLTLLGPDVVERVRARFLPAQRAFEALYPPSQRADWVLQAANPLGPETLGI